MKKLTEAEIEYKLLKIFNRCDVKPDIKKATKYILSIIKKYEKVIANSESKK